MAQDLLLKIKREGEEREAQQKASKFGMNYLDITATPVQIDAFSLVPEEKARQIKVAPFQLKEKSLALAVFNPENKETKELIQNLKSQRFSLNLFIASQSSLEQLWKNYKFAAKKTAQISGKVQIEKSRFQELYKKLTTIEKTKKEILEFDFQAFTTGQLLEVIIAGALSNRASDIHFEAEEKGTRLRFRIDGVLHDAIPELAKETYQFLLSRIKLLSNLKLNVQDKPQDGRFTIELETKAIEVRVSIIPSEYGETIVIRILDPEAIKITLSQLGLRKDDLEIIEKQLQEPNGMILNTGPTGSGKTTTLYAFLLKKLTPEIKIITIEDPIEYHLEDIEQTQVNEEAGYTFANGLRSIMRQDPDVILVGEIRDEETAGIAIQAALTGHLVFSTVHANSAAGAIPRLLDLKVKPVSIGPALNLIIAQRLVRRLCPACKTPKKIDPELQKKIDHFLKNLPSKIDKKDYAIVQIFTPKGCKECANLGYKGRVAVFELLEATDNIKAIITSSVSETEIEKKSRQNGMLTMKEDGILKVLSGVTAFEEVESVTGPLNF